MAFHWQGGWYFERTTSNFASKDDGTVRIFHEYITESGDKKRDIQVDIDADSWASIVASVSYTGECGKSGNRFYKAKEFHMESDSPNGM